MENRESARRHWPAAVTVSMVLHGAIVLAIGMLPGRQFVETRDGISTGALPMSLVDYDPGEVSFIGPRDDHAHEESSSRPGPDLPATDPGSSTLRNPLEVASPREAGSSAHNSAGSDPTTSFFQVEARGQRIVYVVDGSASMGKHGALERACRELESSVQRLPATARFQIIVYNSAAHNLLPRFPDWLAPTPDLVHEVGAALRRLVPEGTTDHAPSLQKAFLLQPDIVFFLTDADDLTEEHLRLVRRLNGGRAVVHTIELNTRNRERSDMPLQLLAREHRGTYRAVSMDP